MVLLFAGLLLPLLLGISFFSFKFTNEDFLEKIKKQMTQFAQVSQTERIHITTDKPFYKPGETLWLQLWVRNAQNLKAAAQSGIVHLEWIDPKGNVAQKQQIILENGTASSDIALNKDDVGGIYKLRAYTNWQKNDEKTLVFEKEIQVQKVVLPRLKSKLDFEREGYGAGETVEATLILESLENQPLSEKPVEIKAFLQGSEFLSEKAKTNAKGELKLQIKLPDNLSTADGTITLRFEHRGQAESISRALPLRTQRIDVEFYPEGGELIAEVPTRVAFKAQNEFQKAADIEGVIENSKGQTVAHFGSFHKGMGAFAFTAKKDESYTARILKPTGIEKTYALPKVLPIAYGMNLENDYANKTLKLRLHAPKKEKLFVVAQMREQLLFTEVIEADKGENTFEVAYEDFPIGTAQITLFDSREIERAERLVFINRDKQLNINIKTDKDKYQPREEVKLQLEVTDAEGIPMPGNFALSVVDDKLISFADNKDGNIRAKLLLEPDLKGEVEEASFYFDKKEEKSLAALDLIMLTQGWRRYAWKEITDSKSFAIKHQAEQTVIGGKVEKSDRSKVKSLKLLNSKGETVAKTQPNADGEFAFHNIKLYEQHRIEVEGEEGRFRPVTINEYGNSYRIAEYIPMPRMMMKNEMAQGGRADEEAVMRAAPFIEGNVMDMLGEAPVEDMIEAEAEEELDDESKVVDKEIDLPQVEAVVGDTIMYKKKVAWDKPRPQKFQNRYYRAKQFPTIDYKDNQNPEIRTDFRSTIFWKGNVKVDASGRAALSFYTSDEITAFRITTEGIAEDGTIGRAEEVFYTQKPFSMDVKIPTQVAMGDELHLELQLNNFSAKNVKGKINIQAPDSWELIKNITEKQMIKAQNTQIVDLHYRVGDKVGSDKFEIKFEGDAHSDAFEAEVETIAKGFPATIAYSGQEKRDKFGFEIKNLVKGSLSAKFTAYPSNLNDLLAGIESILREPYGCFEQTSSSTYPNIMVKNYLREQEIDNSELYARADELLEKGYKRLVSYETADKGYEWFGSNPPHEALTAYGLLEFRDMQQVSSIVDDAMVKRTADWLLSRRDGKGGFERNPKALDSFGRADKDITDAYITYSLTEAGFLNLEAEIDALYESALSSKDPYILALAANTLFNIKDGTRAQKVLDILLPLQGEKGEWTGTRHSVTGSTHQALSVETTSFAVLALLKAQKTNRKLIEQAVKFIVGARSGHGGFGNTQSTIMALKALTTYAKFAKKTAEAGSIDIFIDGKKVASQNYEAGSYDEIQISGLEAHLNEGKHHIEIRYADAVKEPLPYAVQVSWNTHLPNSQKECKLRLKTELSDSKVKLAETVRFNISLENISTDGLPMSVAVIGLPGGLSPQPWQLKQLQEQNAFDFYEILSDGRLVLYYRQMKPEEKRTVALDLKAEIKGKYEAPASSAYLYYTSEFKDWQKTERIEIR
ncbi:MAG: hypothetical protein JJT94_08890 [Bernardetiaceae bacterium]|nr:hypothetical protein [Bernardetiaceae bacterium]